MGTTEELKISSTIHEAARIFCVITDHYTYVT